MFRSQEAGREPVETFYDGYVVNAILDAAYKSAETKQWEKVILPVWRGREGLSQETTLVDYDEHYYLVKEELMTHDGRHKIILKDKVTGKIIERDLV
ncbi:MAG: gfo/Idh/MocA family oxidoreductase, partial [Bacteroidetes bacterium]|nr:gfo/Idh/MocA family oxidoreductase [Fibrella sp.]